MICDSKIQGNALYSLHPTMLFALPIFKNTKKSSGYCFIFYYLINFRYLCTYKTKPDSLMYRGYRDSTLQR